MAESAKNPSGQRLLIVGLACVDFINVAGQYPEEDTDQRLLDQRIARGGNATNTSVILAQLGSPVEWLGTVAKDTLADVIIEDLSEAGVLHDRVCYHDNCKTPVSCVIISAQSGSRTILHANKTLPELDVSDFRRVDLENYSWIHFEGRNQNKVEQMIQRIEEFNERRQSLGLDIITVSIEAEKPGAISRDFLSKGDYVFISKEYSNSLGQSSAEECLKHLRASELLKRGARAICAWGEKGAWGLEENNTIVHSKAYPPIRVVDTLGAGDTFNGGVLHALSKGKSLEEGLKLGCQVAGQKVGQSGFLIDIGALDSHLLHAS